jgi:hypothetical protein
MINTAGIILMRQDRRGLLMELVKLTVQIERTTATNALFFFPMRQRTLVKWTASNITVPQVVDQALQEQRQAIGPASQDKMIQMQTAQWSDPNTTYRIQWRDPNMDQGLQDKTQMEGLPQTTEDKAERTSPIITAQLDNKKIKKNDSVQTARRSTRLMDKRSGEYKSPEERALQVCYPDTFRTHTANQSKENSNAQFKIKDQKTPMDANVARRALQEVGIDCNDMELLHNLETAIKKTIQTSGKGQINEMQVVQPK